MPEGDTIRTAANRVGTALVGHEIESIETPHPRFGKDRWAERLAGSSVRAVDAHGKHLMIRFEGGLTIHSHLRMTGAWGVYSRGQRWHRGRHRAWLVIRTADDEVVQFDGPVLELMTDGRTRFDPRITQLGPDVLADEFDAAAFLRRLRGGSNRLADIRVSLFGPGALTALASRAGELQFALPRKSFYAVHAEPKLFFERSDFSRLIADPAVIGLHVSPKGRGKQAPVPGSLYAWASDRFAGS
jgi:hypothetical protein